MKVITTKTITAGSQRISVKPGDDVYLKGEVPRGMKGALSVSSEMLKEMNKQKIFNQTIKPEAKITKARTGPKGE